MSGLVDRITAVLQAHRLHGGGYSGTKMIVPNACWANGCTWQGQLEDFPAHVAERVAAELPELAELEATKLLLEATREQLSRTIADFCAVRDALPRKQVEQILSAVEDPA